MEKVASFRIDSWTGRDLSRSPEGLVHVFV